MILPKSKKAEKRLEIDLTGEQGNAFYLIGTARHLAHLFYLDKDKITEEMKSGDYENLITVFEKYFGKYVILYR
jgi:hypothetical protein